MDIKGLYKADEQRYDGRMPYKKCGNSGLRLPSLSLGMWHNFGSVDRLENCVKIVHTAFDNGINCFDLANNYGPVYGSAEETFGTIFERSLKPYRDDLFLVTKAGYDMWPGPYGDGGSRKYLFSSIDQSLKRMKVDYVDLFYSHRYDPNTPLEETMQALVDIVRSGRALYIGISNYPAHTLPFVFSYLKDRDVPCLVYQGKYNILHRAPETEGILQACQDAGVGFVAFSPLAQGLLTDRYFNGIPSDSRMAREFFLKSAVLTESMLSGLKELDEIARDRGQSLSAMALAWLLEKEPVTSAIIGASTPEQLKANIKAVENIPFMESELQKIDAISNNI